VFPPSRTHHIDFHSTIFLFASLSLVAAKEFEFEFEHIVRRQDFTFVAQSAVATEKSLISISVPQTTKACQLHLHPIARPCLYLQSKHHHASQLSQLHFDSLYSLSYSVTIVRRSELCSARLWQQLACWPVWLSVPFKLPYQPFPSQDPSSFTVMELSTTSRV
jgi:hypothetical protein